jgi:hypothetical protein
MLSVQGVDAILGGVVQSVAAANVSSGSLTGKNLPVGQSELDKAKVSHNFFFREKKVAVAWQQTFPRSETLGPILQRLVVTITNRQRKGNWTGPIMPKTRCTQEVRLSRETFVKKFCPLTYLLNQACKRHVSPHDFPLSNKPSSVSTLEPMLQLHPGAAFSTTALALL